MHKEYRGMASREAQTGFKGSSSAPEGISTKVYLLPEFKKADYFLKIDNTDDSIDINQIKTILNTIDNITTVYTVETKQIKSKNNLIF